MDPAGDFQFRVHVPYAHIDKMGIVYYARYFVYFEMARSALFRHLGLPYGEMEKRGVMLPVIASHCEYKKPARFDDELVVTIPSIEIRGPVFHVVYEIRRGDELLVTGYTDHVCMSPKGRVLKPMPELKALVEGL